MKNIIVCILFVGIVIALVEVSIGYIILKKGKKYLQQRVELLEQENYLLRDGFFCSYIYDNEQMFNFDLLVNDINGDKRQITSFVKNKSILVYLTNYESCPDCFSLPIQNFLSSSE